MTPASINSSAFRLEHTPAFAMYRLSRIRPSSSGFGLNVLGTNSVRSRFFFDGSYGRVPNGRFSPLYGGLSLLYERFSPLFPYAFSRLGLKGFCSPSDRRSR